MPANVRGKIGAYRLEAKVEILQALGKKRKWLQGITLRENPVFTALSLMEP